MKVAGNENKDEKIEVEAPIPQQIRVLKDKLARLGFKRSAKIGEKLREASISLKVLRMLVVEAEIELESRK
ncbi:hypothetical protein KAR26_03720 [Candidatus Parcubacteria bacterium]|nr:hypothetical protein [Candidatus Parcubacteria bacterium]MCK5592039.1 hypothetical protein [Candidatus Paceibacterota bacterium]